MKLDEEALRRELREFPRPAIDAFVSAVRPIVVLYDIAPELPKRRDKPKKLERLKHLTETYLERLTDELASPNAAFDADAASERQDRARGIGKLAKAIEGAGGVKQVRKNRRARLNRESEQQFGEWPLETREDLEAFAEALRAARPPMPPLEAAVWESINATGLLLEQLTEELEKPIPIGDGRPAANADGLLTQIGYAYERVLHKNVTSTKHKTFYNIARVITGQEDPERPVLAAIREIRKSQPTKPLTK